MKEDWDGWEVRKFQTRRRDEEISKSFRSAGEIAVLKVEAMSCG